MYTYFVSYCAQNEDYDLIYGNCTIDEKSPITTLEQIREIEEDICDMGEYSNVTVLNYILLKKFGE